MVTTIPTSKLPKSFRSASMTPKELDEMDRDETDDLVGSMQDDMGRRGQILWIRGLTRLQHQVREIGILCAPRNAMYWGERGLLWDGDVGASVILVLFLGRM